MKDAEMNLPRKIELLSPAKNLAVGYTAINNGADAVYIGAPAFGARKAAANPIEDLETLVDYAHRFYCRVFVTLNTILYDRELAEAEKMIRRLYNIGVDALIIQDPGILKLDLPPLPLHASTQMHNYDLERIKFLDKIGFQRIVLARELSLQQIKAIRKEVKAELEVFIHGALCVSLSGQCYLSQYMFGRSANRGECAQPCRMKWSVKDSEGKILLKDRYLLSLKDLNLSSHISELIDAGVDSFKIEGRLKEENYVANVTNYYSSLINKQENIRRIGSGHVISSFTPDLERTFNRGYSDYFIAQRRKGLVNMDTPKSMGKVMGTVQKVKSNRLWVNTTEEIHNGDGLCYIERGELKGIKVNQVQGNCIICNDVIRVLSGTFLYRNYDHQFVMQLEKRGAVRKICISIQAAADSGHLCLTAQDEDGIQASYTSPEIFEKANHPGQKERICRQLAKCGDTEYECTQIEYVDQDILFIPAAVVNAARRCLLENLSEARKQGRKVMPPTVLSSFVKGPSVVDWHYNIVNMKAEQFYREHGAIHMEPGFEKTTDVRNKELMCTCYCLLYELGRCRKITKNDDLKFPLFICNDKHTFRLDWDCEKCFMKIIS